MFRTRNADQLTYLDITKLVQEGKLPAWTHMIPNPDRDTDSSVIRAIAPDADCGIGAMNTLSARITDCNTKNPATHLWDSKLSGISGEGDWMLVTKQGNFTLWMDVTTGLIWSDLVQTANWSTASGARGMEATAICRADADNVALGKIPDTQIQWRLPTRSDFLMADINGARFVLPNLDQQYWTASHDGNSSAWSIFQETGILEKESENQVLSVRCVGIVKK